MKKLKSLVLGMLLVSASMIMAQIETPAPSPGAMLQQKVGLTDVSVDYSRPAAKGRVIFAAKDALVPFGEVWRTGANTATKIVFSNDVKVEGKELKAGAYAILSKPGADMWAIHFYKHESTNFGTYLEKTPDAIVMVKPRKSGSKVENFTINIDNISATGAELQFAWENVVVPVALSVDTDKAVMSSIDRVMAGPSANDYFNAATYYHESGKDLKKALEWVQKATKVSDPKFWQVRRESLILADMGRKQEAIAAAKLSLDLAKAANNMDYVRMNEKSLAEWAKK